MVAQTELERIRAQTDGNSKDIAAVAATVSQLANTVERHERMMVAGFDKLETSMITGLNAVNDKLSTQTSNARPPWWQLIGVGATVFTLFAGVLVATNSPQDNLINRNRERIDQYSIIQKQQGEDISGIRETQKMREVLDQRTWDAVRDIAERTSVAKGAPNAAR